MTKPWKVRTKVCVIDLDGTITQFTHTLNEIGKLKLGAKSTLHKLKSAGFKIIIDTARPQDHSNKVRKYLLFHKVPFDEVRCGLKPASDYYIDDKSIRFTSWKDVFLAISKDNPELRRKINKKD